MAATIKTAISIDKTLFEQAEALAQQLKISRSHLFVIAVKSYTNAARARLCKILAVETKNP